MINNYLFKVVLLSGDESCDFMALHGKVPVPYCAYTLYATPGHVSLSPYLIDVPVISAVICTEGAIISPQWIIQLWIMSLSRWFYRHDSTHRAAIALLHIAVLYKSKGTMAYCIVSSNKLQVSLQLALLFFVVRIGLVGFGKEKAMSHTSWLLFLPYYLDEKMYSITAEWTCLCRRL